MTARPQPRSTPRKPASPSRRQVKVVRPPRSPHDLARAMFIQADQKRTRRAP